MANPKEDGEVVVEKWKRLQILGAGGFGMVTLWTNLETNEKIALKQCRWSSESSGMTAKHKERWKQEVDIMNRLEHPSVVRAIRVPECLDKPKSDLPILGMEFCSGGDLRRVLNKPENCCGLPEEQIRQILKQIASAIEYLHSLRIIHRDLKPENIVLQPQGDNKIIYKLIDLGYAKELDQSSLCSSFVGTLQYLAPELFLSKQYSSAVDNWSFGLLTHETITGRRPFLPNLSPAQWIPLVANKSSHDICAYVEANGKVMFSKELSEFNQISPSLKFHMENWLRQVLEWDPKKRGGKFAFQFLSEILIKYIVHVFVINSLEMYSYEINEDTKLCDLKMLIKSNTNINCEDQHLVLPRGLLVNQEIGKQLIENWYNQTDGKEDKQPITICLFDKSKIADYNAYSACIIPPSVEQIMLNPTQLMAFEEQKTSWRHAMWVSQQAIKKYRYLHESVKLILMNCLSLQQAMQRASTKVSVEFSKLLAVAQFFKCAIKFNLEQCDRLKISSSILRSSKSALEELKEIYNMQEPVAQIITRTQSISNKLFDYNKSPAISSFLKSKPVDDSLAQVYMNILSAYDMLRRKNKEERSKRNDNTQMVKLLCDCFQLEEKLMRQLYQYLRPMIELSGHIEEHYQQMNATLVSVAESLKKLNSLQTKIQSDLWLYLGSPNKDQFHSSEFNSLGRQKLPETSLTESSPLANDNDKTIDDIISEFVTVDVNDVKN